MTVLVGETGGRYELREPPIAAGGQGTIYEAVDRSDGRLLVVKVARAPGAEGETVRLAALRLAALAEDPVAGPLLVPVWDVGRWDDRPFVVLERLERTLEEHLRAHPPGPAVDALLAAMAALARAGVVHGDLKPSNVFVRADGDRLAVLLGDLWSGADEVPVSPGFSAPEAWRGERPTAAADAYALGATLWAAFAGAPPACAAGPEARPPTAAELRASGIPERLRGTVAALLAPDPAARPRLTELDRPPRRIGATAWPFAVVAALALAAALASRPTCPAGFAADGPACVAPDGRRIVRVPAGRFTAGARSAEERAWSADAVPHEVVLTRPVWFRTTEVTQAEYAALLGENPVAVRDEQLPDGTFHSCRAWRGHDLLRPDLPVACVSWLDAVHLANAASLRDGLRPAYAIEPDHVRWDRAADGWRLPTEAEWEWAAQGAGAGERWAGAPSRDAICGWGNPRDQAAPEAWGNEVACTDGAPVLARVGAYAPNALGLHDMVGNVAEWVWDWYDDYPTARVVDPAGGAAGPNRALRGGGWNQIARPISARYAANASTHGLNVGVRLVRTAR